MVTPRAFQARAFNHSANPPWCQERGTSPHAPFGAPGFEPGASTFRHPGVCHRAAARRSWYRGQESNLHDPFGPLGPEPSASTKISPPRHGVWGWIRTTNARSRESRSTVWRLQPFSHPHMLVLEGRLELPRSFRTTGPSSRRVYQIPPLQHSSFTSFGTGGGTRTHRDPGLKPSACTVPRRPRSLVVRDGIEPPTHRASTCRSTI